MEWFRARDAQYINTEDSFAELIIKSQSMKQILGRCIMLERILYSQTKKRTSEEGAWKLCTLKYYSVKNLQEVMNTI